MKAFGKIPISQVLKESSSELQMRQGSFLLARRAQDNVRFAAHLLR